MVNWVARALDFHIQCRHPRTDNSKANRFFTVANGSFLLVFVTLSLGGCSLLPSMYVDRLPVDDTPPPVEEQLGGEINFIPVTAEVVRELTEEHRAILLKKRDMAHELYQQNALLKKSYEYRVGPTDVLSIVTWGNPELNIIATARQPATLPRAVVSTGSDDTSPAVGTGHEVDLNGDMFFPYIGLVPVAGKTLSEIRGEITRLLKRYIPNPQLDVGIAQYRSQRAYVLGEVNTPRAIPVTQVPLEIIDAITQVGGLRDNADSRNAILVRDGQQYHVDIQAILEGDLTQNYILQDGDLISIPDNRYNSVFLLGEFEKNGQVVIPQDRFFSLADAISSNVVGGFKTTVDARRVFVFRYREGEEPGDQFKMPMVYHLNLESAEAMLVAANFPLAPRDVIYAAPANLTRWNRVVEQVLPTIQAIYMPVRTIWYIDDLTNSPGKKSQ